MYSLTRTSIVENNTNKLCSMFVYLKIDLFKRIPVKYDNSHIYLKSVNPRKHEEISIKAEESDVEVCQL